MKKRNIIISWILRGLVALGLLMASLGKLTNNPSVIEMFNNWGFPDRFYFIIGIIEITLAVLLLIPKTLKPSIIGIVVILIGASLTHIINDPLSQLIRPLIFFILVAIIYKLNFITKKEII
ncbi:DoxX family protein [Winogradskyella sp. A2]|uniref:DoxX family protein n=1 Tax=Winogradskyella sp. A2 TaxID=3366944 RepID=UPI00398C43E7